MTPAAFSETIDLSEIHRGLSEAIAALEAVLRPQSACVGRQRPKQKGSVPSDRLL
jgi:hypothetical protein